MGGGDKNTSSSTRKKVAAPKKNVSKENQKSSSSNKVVAQKKNVSMENKKSSSSSSSNKVSIEQTLSKSYCQVKNTAHGVAIYYKKTIASKIVTYRCSNESNNNNNMKVTKYV